MLTKRFVLVQKVLTYMSKSQLPQSQKQRQNKNPQEILDKNPEVEAVLAARMWSGALPRPEDLEKFNDIIPDGAERIMRLAENEQQHRISIERQTLPAEIKAFERGQSYGLGLSLVAIIAAGLMGVLGVDWRICVSVVGVPVLAVAKALVEAIKKSN